MHTFENQDVPAFVCLDDKDVDDAVVAVVVVVDHYDDVVDDGVGCVCR